MLVKTISKIFGLLVLAILCQIAWASVLLLIAFVFTRFSVITLYVLFFFTVVCMILEHTEIHEKIAESTKKIWLNIPEKVADTAKTVWSFIFGVLKVFVVLSTLYLVFSFVSNILFTSPYSNSNEEHDTEYENCYMSQSVDVGGSELICE